MGGDSVNFICGPGWISGSLLGRRREWRSTKPTNAAPMLNASANKSKSSIGMRFPTFTQNGIYAQDRQAQLGISLWGSSRARETKAPPCGRKEKHKPEAIPEFPLVWRAPDYERRHSARCLLRVHTNE